MPFDDQTFTTTTTTNITIIIIIIIVVVVVVVISIRSMRSTTSTRLHGGRLHPPGALAQYFSSGPLHRNQILFSYLVPFYYCCLLFIIKNFLKPSVHRLAYSHLGTKIPRAPPYERLWHPQSDTRSSSPKIVNTLDTWCNTCNTGHLSEQDYTCPGVL